MIQIKPKILVINHNCFSEDTANGRTISTFFRKWDNTKVSQVFVNNELPNSFVCNSFFRITDEDMLSSLLTFKSAGNVLENNKISIDESLKKKIGISLAGKIKNIKKIFPSLLYILRNILWSTRKWDTKNINNWIDNFQPDLILLQPGDYSFLYKIARRISKNKKIPLVIYNSEDYYLKDKFSISPIFYLQRYFFKKEVEKTFNTAQLVIYSNDLLQLNLHKYFKNRSAVILTSSEIKLSNTIGNNKILRLVYAGNLGHERWKSLMKIAKIAQTINKKLVIDVYSGYLPKIAKKYFSLENGINYKGKVSYDRVLEVISENDVVIHTEGFSNFTKWDIRHGFSTKIADLLTSGKCFLMFGPKEVACVDYLIKNKAAWVATSDNELLEVLHKIIDSENERQRYLKNARNLVNERHNKDKNCAIFEKLMVEVSQNYLNQK